MTRLIIKTNPDTKTFKLVQYAVVFEPFEEEGLEYVKQGCGAM